MLCQWWNWDEIKCFTSGKASIQPKGRVRLWGVVWLFTPCLMQLFLNMDCCCRQHLHLITETVVHCASVHMTNIKKTLTPKELFSCLSFPSAFLDALTRNGSSAGNGAYRRKPADSTGNTGPQAERENRESAGGDSSKGFSKEQVEGVQRWEKDVVSCEFVTEGGHCSFFCPVVNRLLSWKPLDSLVALPWRSGGHHGTYSVGSESQRPGNLCMLV